ncbi:unnamed protein product [Amoebophrya sp. A120]|nr:unnamed protein product [Amoebophrya sp. A120]|eukprot:GSA120T00023374001.1
MSSASSSATPANLDEWGSGLDQYYAEGGFDGEDDDEGFNTAPEDVPAEVKITNAQSSNPQGEQISGKRTGENENKPSATSSDHPHTPPVVSVAASPPTKMRHSDMSYHTPAEHGTPELPLSAGGESKNRGQSSLTGGLNASPETILLSRPTPDTASAKSRRFSADGVPMLDLRNMHPPVHEQLSPATAAASTNLTERPNMEDVLDTEDVVDAPAEQAGARTTAGNTTTTEQFDATNASNAFVVPLGRERSTNSSDDMFDSGTPQTAPQHTSSYGSAVSSHSVVLNKPQASSSTSSAPPQHLADYVARQYPTSTASEVVGVTSTSSNEQQLLEQQHGNRSLRTPDQAQLERIIGTSASASSSRLTSRHQNSTFPPADDCHQVDEFSGVPGGTSTAQIPNNPRAFVATPGEDSLHSARDIRGPTLEDVAGWRGSSNRSPGNHSLDYSDEENSPMVQSSTQNKRTEELHQPKEHQLLLGGEVVDQYPKNSSSSTSSAHQEPFPHYASGEQRTREVDASRENSISRPAPPVISGDTPNDNSFAGVGSPFDIATPADDLRPAVLVPRSARNVLASSVTGKAEVAGKAVVPLLADEALTSTSAEEEQQAALSRRGSRSGRDHVLQPDLSQPTSTTSAAQPAASTDRVDIKSADAIKQHTTGEQDPSVRFHLEQIAELRRENEQLRHERSVSEARMQKAFQEQVAAAEQDYRAKLHSVEQDLVGTRKKAQQADGLEIELGNMKQAMAELTAELANVRQGARQGEAFKRELDKMHPRVKELTQALEATKQELQTATTEQNKAQMKVAQLEEESEAKHEEITALKSEVAQFRRPTENVGTQKEREFDDEREENFGYDFNEFLVSDPNRLLTKYPELAEGRQGGAYGQACWALLQERQYLQTHYDVLEILRSTLNANTGDLYTQLNNRSIRLAEERKGVADSSATTSLEAVEASEHADALWAEVLFYQEHQLSSLARRIQELEDEKRVYERRAKIGTEFLKQNKHQEAEKFVRDYVLQISELKAHLNRAYNAETTPAEVEEIQLLLQEHTTAQVEAAARNDGTTACSLSGSSSSSVVVHNNTEIITEVGDEPPRRRNNNDADQRKPTARHLAAREITLRTKLVQAVQENESLVRRNANLQLEREHLLEQTRHLTHETKQTQAALSLKLRTEAAAQGSAAPSCLNGTGGVAFAAGAAVPTVTAVHPRVPVVIAQPVSNSQAKGAPDASMVNKKACTYSTTAEVRVPNYRPAVRHAPPVTTGTGTPPTTGNERFDSYSIHAGRVTAPAAAKQKAAAAKKPGERKPLYTGVR